MQIATEALCATSRLVVAVVGRNTAAGPALALLTTRDTVNVCRATEKALLTVNKLLHAVASNNSRLTLTRASRKGLVMVVRNC